METDSGECVKIGGVFMSSPNIVLTCVSFALFRGSLPLFFFVTSSFLWDHLTKNILVETFSLNIPFHNEDL